MSPVTYIMIFLIITITFVYTLSYAKWLWKNKYRLGSVAVIIVALLTAVMPVYALFLTK